MGRMVGANWGLFMLKGRSQWSQYEEMRGMSTMSLNKLKGRERLSCRIGIVQAISLTHRGGACYMDLTVFELRFAAVRSRGIEFIICSWI